MYLTFDFKSVFAAQFSTAQTHVQERNLSVGSKSVFEDLIN